MNRLRVAVLVAGHATTDLYQGAGPALVAFLVAERHYGYVAAAGISLAASVLSSVAQPLFGLLTDRRRLPLLVPVAMSTAAVGIAVSGLGDSYALTWLAVALSGLGVAMYHPEAARLARVLTGGSHSGMSWFALGGNLGFAAGPLLVAPVLGAAGVGGTPWLVLPAVVGVALTVGLLLEEPAAPGRPGTAGPASDGTDDWRAFGRLSVVVVCRSVVTIGLSTFLALLVAQRLGTGPAAGTLALSVLFLAGAAGTLLGGRCAARFGRIRTLRVAYAASLPALAGVLYGPPQTLLACVALTGVALYVPFSLHNTLGQDYLPTRIGTASGVTLGLAVSVGGVAAPPLGALAQAAGLTPALSTLLLAPVIALLAARRLTEPVMPPGAHVPLTGRRRDRLGDGPAPPAEAAAQKVQRVAPPGSTVATA